MRKKIQPWPLHTPVWNSGRRCLVGDSSSIGTLSEWEWEWGGGVINSAELRSPLAIKSWSPLFSNTSRRPARPPPVYSRP